MIQKSTMTIKNKCPICNQDQVYYPLASMTDQWVAIKCQNCQVTSAYPLPSEGQLIDYYKKYVTTKQSYDRDSVLVDLHQPILKWLVEKFNSQKKISFLDFGFGVGAFLKQVTRNNFPAYGVEFSSQNCQQLEEYCLENNVEIPMVKLPEESLTKFFGQKFDCITLFQVIEHLLDPLAVISSLAEYQDSGGLIYIECPNNDALFLKVKNLIRYQVNREGFFDSLNPPQHIYGFNKKSLKILLENSGYVPVEINDYYFADQVHQVETMFWYPSLSDIVQNKKMQNFYSISKFLIGAFDPLASRLMGAGGGLYALARKQ